MYPHTLHQRIGIAVAIVIFALSIAMAALVGGLAERRITSFNAATLTGLAEQMGRELSFGMERLGRTIVNESTRELFRDPNARASDMRAALDEFRRANPEFAYLAIVDVPSAKVLAATGGIFEGGDARGRPTFDRGKDGLFFGDVHEAVRLAELLPRPANGEPLRFLDIAAPVTSKDGTVRRVLATHVAFEWTAEIRDHVFSRVRDAHDVDAFLVDSAGKVVLSGLPDVRVGASLLAPAATPSPAQRVSWPDGKDYLTATASTQPHGRFEGFGWRVVARQPYATTLAPVESARHALLAAGIALAVLASTVAWFIGRRLTQPLRQFAQAAAASDGVSPMPNPVAHESVGEVQAMDDAFRRLAGKAREHHQASAESEHKFQTLAASLPDIVWVADAAGQMDYINRELPFAAKGQSVATIADLGSLMKPSDRSSFDAIWNAACEQALPTSFRCQLGDAGTGGRARWFDISMRPLLTDEGALRRWVGTVTDVDDDVNEAQRVAMALEQAEHTARVRDAFIATASHELRSPLNAILGWTEVALRPAATQAQIGKALDVIRRNALRQAALISDMIDMSAAMAGRLSISPSRLDLAELATEVVRAHQAVATSKGVSLAYEGGRDQWVEADRSRLALALGKLVDNAVKFTDAGGTVSVRLREDGVRLCIDVQDDGRGIASEFLPHIFERMRQEDESFARRAGGLGLGLAIARAIVRLHGGELSVHSGGTGCGTTVTVSMPASRPLPATSSVPSLGTAQVPARAPVLEGITVLLVDDEADAREIAEVALGSLGARVKVACSGAEALQELKTASVDVLVSDIGMPGMDGLELVRRVRALTDAPVSALPAVALTAFAQESNKREGLVAGFDAYVAKPISIQQLAQAIVTAMTRTRGLRHSGSYQR